MLTVIYQHQASGNRVLFYKGPRWNWDEIERRTGIFLTILKKQPC